MFAPMKTSQANPMHALSEAMRLFEPIVSAPRWNPRTRRLYFRLRDLGRGVIEALHDSRRLPAARLIDQHRHLIQDGRCIGSLRRANDTASGRRQAEITE